MNALPPDPPRKLVAMHVVESCKGGVGTFVANLIRSQASDPQIAAVHLAYNPDLAGDMIVDVPAVRHEYWSSRAGLRLKGVSKVVNHIIRQQTPDVVFLHATFAGIYGRLPRKTTWGRIYCAHGWAFCQDVPGYKRSMYARVEKYLSRRTDAIIDISADEHCAALGAGVTAPIHRVIYNGLPPAHISGGRALNVGPGINLGFIGRFDRQKGLDLLMPLFADASLAETQLWLIGEAVREFSPPLPVLPNVHLLGWVENTQLDSYIACFDALVVPSRWEGFGLVALEAMRNSKPVIASRVGGLPEIVTHGHDGLLMDMNDANSCRRLLMALDKAELARMGRNARETFERRFRWDNCYTQWKMVAEQVAAWRQRII